MKYVSYRLREINDFDFDFFDFWHTCIERNATYYKSLCIYLLSVQYVQKNMVYTYGNEVQGKRPRFYFVF